ncbi:hypothetical protein TOPH_06088, partial [Tolypocladium ophioglossoides CBS 100239]
QAFLRYCSPTSLGEIKRFASHGGPDLRDLRGVSMRSCSRSIIADHSQHRFTRSKYKMSLRESSLGRRKRGSQSPVKSSGTPNTTTTKSTGPYDRNFQQNLVDHCIYPDRYTYPDGEVPARPDNLGDIKQALRQPRLSLSPSQFSEGTFDRFQGADAHAFKEAQVMATVMPIIGGRVKGPDRSAAMAKRQLCYDMALGARGMNALQTYNNPNATYDNRAYTLGCTYQDGQLKIYTSHPIPPSTPGLHTGQQTMLNPGSNEPTSYESETSADELSLDLRPPVKRTKSRSRSPRKKP